MTGKGEGNMARQSVADMNKTKKKKGVKVKNEETNKKANNVRQECSI